MDEEIPYVDDLPYEEQIQIAQEEAVTSLKERIGNRIYLLEDSRKRKLVNTEETPQDEESDDGITGADLSHRPNALLLYGPPISQLPTTRVFAYATHFDAHPIGLEWVDDESCVLVFASRKNALQAWEVLRRPSHTGNSTGNMQLDDGEEGSIFPAPPLPLALYPIEERINSVLGTQKSIALKKRINIRWARPSDVKQPGARVRSEFYKKHGETAGKEGIPRHKRQRQDSNDVDVRRELDADLDTLLNPRGDEPLTDSRVGEKRKRSQHEEERRLLDDELDLFLTHGDQSNIQVSADRPTRHSQTIDEGPQSRRKVRSGERWHSSEMRRRRSKKTDDEGGFGMRAWRGEGRRLATSGKNTRRPRQTQEELDRELDEFLGE